MTNENPSDKTVNFSDYKDQYGGSLAETASSAKRRWEKVNGGILINGEVHITCDHPRGETHDFRFVSKDSGECVNIPLWTAV